MKSIPLFFAAAALFFVTAAPAGSAAHAIQTDFLLVQDNSSAGSLVEALTAAEKQFWEAWKNKQPDRFGNAMADDAVFFGLYGVTGKSDLVEEQRQSVTTCQVESYALTNLRVIPIDADSAILTLRRRAACHLRRLPRSALYARRIGLRSPQWPLAKSSSL